MLALENLKTVVLAQAPGTVSLRHVPRSIVATRHLMVSSTLTHVTFIPRTILLLSILLNAAVVAVPLAPTPLLDGTTAKSASDFRQCFVALERDKSHPVSLVPHEDGVRISNEGANGVSNPYRLRFTERSDGNRVQLVIARSDGPEAKPLVEAVKSCW